jgi:hypothetical protein
MVLAVAHTGCGLKASPRPPEDVLPKTISDLHATNLSEGVQLSWSRPLFYADGSRMADLAGFVIERAVGTEPHVPFARLSVLEVSDRDRFRQIKRFQYLDRDTRAGTTYRYRVVSFTLDRYVSKPSNAVMVERAVPSEEKHALLPTP